MFGLELVIVIVVTIFFLGVIHVLLTGKKVYFGKIN